MEIDLNMIKRIVQSKPKTFVKPREFFIAWQGVPTLAYNGYSATLMDIKNEIAESIPHLRKENPGSLWPKTTLGALGDDKMLLWEDAYNLREICTELNGQIDPQRDRFEINSLSVVVFECRSLERRLITYPIELAGPDRGNDDPPPHHIELVEQTMAQFSKERLLQYLPDLTREGNRISDYRKTHIEATLVYDLPKPDKQPDLIKQFQEAVERKLPGVDMWFKPESRHMTVRALVS